MRINRIFYLQRIKLDERGLDGSRWLISSTLLETHALVWTGVRELNLFVRVTESGQDVGGKKAQTVSADKRHVETDVPAGGHEDQ